jgi:hypothetical protein
VVVVVVVLSSSSSSSLLLLIKIFKYHLLFKGTFDILAILLLEYFKEIAFIHNPLVEVWDSHYACGILMC